MNIWIAVIAVVIIIAFFFAEAWLEKRRRRHEYEYRKKGCVMTQSEKICFDALVKAVGDKYDIFPQIHLPSILDHKVVGQNWYGALGTLTRSRLISFYVIRQPCRLYWPLSWMACPMSDPTDRKGVQYTSQLFSNVYLNELDQYVKREMKAVCYVRYCEDFGIIAESREYLGGCVENMRQFCKENLLLEIHPRKIILRKMSQGFDFLGYIILPHPYDILDIMQTETFVAPVSIESTFATIAEIRQRIAAMGANDSEFFLLDQIVDKLTKGDMNGAEAVQEARSILDGKQDYH